MTTAIIRPGGGKLFQHIQIGEHRLIADEPEDEGGEGRGPTPSQFLLAALGSCTAMTLQLYAQRKGWPMEGLEVRVSQGKEDGVHVIRRRIEIRGALDDEQRARMLEIAGKCPVARTLSGSIRIESELAPNSL
jgi:putative redox protein